MSKIKWQFNKYKKSNKGDLLDSMTSKEVEIVKNFHESFPQYEKTPLHKLENLAKDMNIEGFYLKDESYRFGLNAFKVLGGSYAMAKYMAQKLSMNISDLAYKNLISDEIREKLGPITFYTATDGNHGRGVAWTANKLKQKSVVYMPMGSTEIRLNNILAENAEASIIDANYDEAVRKAADEAEKNNEVVIQDTAWDGYEEIPTWIMQGYGTMASEATEQLKDLNVDAPTHVFIQAGVGSLAGAVQCIMENTYKDNPPKVIVAESDLADCLYKSAKINDGKPHNVGGTMQTLMAGLACGEPNTITFEILKEYTTCFVSCPDWVAANGMRILSSPLGADDRVVSGESGAVTTGLVYEVLTNPKLKELKEGLELDENSKILVFSTEGDTDPELYRDIIWKGRNEK